jgi:hypothetical protein
MIERIRTTGGGVDHPHFQPAGVAWLTRVIEAAEAARPYSQRGPLYELRLWGVLRNSGVRGYRMF